MFLLYKLWSWRVSVRTGMPAVWGMHCSMPLLHTCVPTLGIHAHHVSHSVTPCPSLLTPCPSLLTPHSSPLMSHSSLLIPRALPSDANADWVLATSHYGEDFVAAVSKGAAMATQFHPEKSGATGEGRDHVPGRCHGECSQRSTYGHSVVVNAGEWLQVTHGGQHWAQVAVVKAKVQEC